MPDGWGVDPSGRAEAPRFPVQAHLCGGLLGAAGGTALLGWLEYLWLDLDLYPGQLTFWLTLGSFVLAIVSLSAYIKTARESRVLGLPGVAAGVLLAYAGTFLLAQPGTNLVWRAEPDRPSSIRAVGAWLDERTVIRVRPDQAIAYSVDDGAVAWRFTPPGRDTVCAMSATTSGGVGLIGHGGTGEKCSAVTAVDLLMGRGLWTRGLDGDARDADAPVRAQVAIGGGLAVLRERPGVRALDLRSGRERWRDDAPPGCRPIAVAGGPTRAVAVAEQCGNGAWVRTPHPADGRRGVRARLSDQAELDRLQILSVDPLVVWVREKGARGVDAVLSLGARGERRASIQIAGPRFDLKISPDIRGLAGPARGAVIAHGLLITPAVRPGDTKTWTDRNGVGRSTTGRLVAHSLSDGRRLWTSDEFDGEVRGLAGGRYVTVVTGQGPLIEISPQTGRAKSIPTPADPPFELVGLWADGDRYVLVEGRGARDEHHPPVQVLVKDI